MLRLIACLLFVSLPLAAQESASLVAFRNRILNQPQVLTDYSADTERTYEFQAEALSQDKPRSREFAYFYASSVTSHGNVVEIHGERRFVVMDSKTHQLVLTSIHAPMKISLVMEGETIENALPAAAKLLFWPSLEEALASVPDYAAKMVPATFDPDKRAYVKCNPCGSGKPYHESTSIERSEDGVVQPQLTRQVDPDMPKEMFQQRGIQKEVMVGFTVLPDGKPDELWLVRPVGEPFDMESVKAVRQYRFKPATRNGKPVAVRLNVAVHFSTQP